MTHMSEKRIAHSFLFGKPERRPLGRPRCKWEGGNIKSPSKSGT